MPADQMPRDDRDPVGVEHPALVPSQVDHDQRCGVVEHSEVAPHLHIAPAREGDPRTQLMELGHELSSDSRRRVTRQDGHGSIEIGEPLDQRRE